MNNIINHKELNEKNAHLSTYKLTKSEIRSEFYTVTEESLLIFLEEN